jgi:hypothetical protein
MRVGMGSDENPGVDQQRLFEIFTIELLVSFDENRVGQA